MEKSKIIQGVHIVHTMNIVNTSLLATQPDISSDMIISFLEGLIYHMKIQKSIILPSGPGKFITLKK